MQQSHRQLSLAQLIPRHLQKCSLVFERLRFLDSLIIDQLASLKLGFLLEKGALTLAFSPNSLKKDKHWTALTMSSDGDLDDLILPRSRPLRNQPWT